MIFTSQIHDNGDMDVDYLVDNDDDCDDDDILTLIIDSDFKNIYNYHDDNIQHFHNFFLIGYILQICDFTSQNYDDENMDDDDDVKNHNNDDDNIYDLDN